MSDAFVGEGDVFKITAKNGAVFHCKVIAPYIVSSSDAVSGCSLVYIYENAGIQPHSFYSLYTVKVFRFTAEILKAFKYAGNEAVMNWEKNLDAGLTDISGSKDISENEISGFYKNCIITKHCGGKITATPFVNTLNERIDHIPLIRLDSGGFTSLEEIMTELDNYDY